MDFAEQIELEDNQNRYVQLVKSISRENANIDGLLNWLYSSDFFSAPASSKYHNACEGGLCKHCLTVYDNLLLINTQKDLNLNVDSMKIVALFHDISKTNYYKKDVKNKKVYCETGSRTDAGGKYDWVSEPCYVIRDVTERLCYGSHEMSSEFMIRCYIPLTMEESVAILHHMGGMNFDSAKDDIPSIYKHYPLAVSLYLADMMAVYMDESK